MKNNSPSEVHQNNIIIIIVVGVVVVVVLIIFFITIGLINSTGLQLQLHVYGKYIINPSHMC